MSTKTENGQVETMDNQLEGELHSELVIGIVCAVGTESNYVIDLMKARLGRAGYQTKVVKISELVIRPMFQLDSPIANSYERINELMTKGNEARAMCEGNDAILALGAATQIFATRKTKGDIPQPAQKTAFIIDSLKRPEEVEELRSIYPSGFILVGIHADSKRRKMHLTNNLGMTGQQADLLVDRDSEEFKEPHGQRLNKTFHLADFFVRISDSHDKLRCDIERIIELWFGNPFITPTFNEHAMFMAFAAALRSADLSRQVGAVITNHNQILSTGANDCPHTGGGLYWPERDKTTLAISDFPRGRDYTREDGDSNRAEQIRIVDKIVKEAERYTGLDSGELRNLLNDKNSSIRHLTEYGRVVHAEMEALLSCSRSGQSAVGGTLYCTTFPCHNCAKHIVAAGIKNVVYIEPYPKSKALDFHDDSIVPVEEPGLFEESDKRVRFTPFVGIGPRRFFDLFSMHLGSSYPLKRKIDDTGKVIEWRIENAQLRIQMKPVSYMELEALACKEFNKVSKSITKEGISNDK